MTASHSILKIETETALERHLGALIDSYVCVKVSKLEHPIHILLDRLRRLSGISVRIRIDINGSRCLQAYGQQRYYPVPILFMSPSFSTCMIVTGYNMMGLGNHSVIKNMTPFLSWGYNSDKRIITNRLYGKEGADLYNEVNATICDVYGFIIERTHL